VSKAAEHLSQQELESYLWGAEAAEALRGLIDAIVLTPEGESRLSTVESDDLVIGGLSVERSSRPTGESLWCCSLFRGVRVL